METPHVNPVPGPSGNAVPITEADLHAYADGQLPAGRRAEVEAFLDSHPAERERVQDWQVQNDALRDWLAPVLDEPLPLRMPLVAPASAPWWRSLAAGVLIAAVSAGSAWWLRGMADHGALGMALWQPAPDGLAARAPLEGFAHRAAVAHVVYSPDARRPVEVPGDQEQALVNWLTKRMGAAVRAPDLRGLGYSLMGGRLLPGGKGPVAQFMFGDAQGGRLTLYVTREDAGRETAFRFGQDGPVNVFYWVDKDFGYAISAGADRQDLLRVAESVYQQLAPAPR